MLYDIYTFFINHFYFKFTIICTLVTTYIIIWRVRIPNFGLANLIGAGKEPFKPLLLDFFDWSECFRWVLPSFFFQLFVWSYYLDSRFCAFFGITSIFNLLINKMLFFLAGWDDIFIVFLAEWLVLFWIIALGALWFSLRRVNIIATSFVVSVWTSFYLSTAIVIMWVVFVNFEGSFIFLNSLIWINSTIWFTKFILLILTFFVIFFSCNYNEGEKKLEFIVLMLISLLGMFLIISSNDLFFLYLSIELMSLPLYVLLGSKKSIINIGSSVKYFITGAVISVFMLLGVSLIYGYFGTTNYMELNDLLLSKKGFSNFDILYLGFCFLLILVTFFFKLGLAPFHFWVADLYEGGPLIVIFFITLAPKLAMFMAFYELFMVSLNISESFYVYELCYAIGLLSVLVGSWGGLKESKLMRLLGQSSIVNMGFFFLILASSHFEGLLIFLYIYVIYSLLLVQLFGVLIVLKGQIKNIASLPGLAGYPFLLFFSTALCLLSLAAIPPLSGFFIKFYIFDSMINLGRFFSVFFLLLHSIISAIFYMRYYTLCGIMLNGTINL